MQEGAVAKRGRPSLGAAAHVRKLDGDELTKHRLAAVLRTLTGELSIEAACEELGLSPAQLHRLRDRALQGALGALEPGTPGRPPSTPPLEPSRLTELEAEVRELKMELRAAQLREEIAVVLPHLAKQAASVEKKRQRRRRR